MVIGHRSLGIGHWALALSEAEVLGIGFCQIPRLLLYPKLTFIMCGKTLSFIELIQTTLKSERGFSWTNDKYFGFSTRRYALAELSL
jgi:hypothetical protein